ncbi:Ribosomal RNA small subunit methyltransferase C [Roseibaca ekhonensis]|uniref:Ribosomal RNA small subunit methyltransferase C n=1 Tax=Roseinatronobacter ekhonensis TaxID=254356 RepID=A0A3B0MBS3_9RHOB|nr:methyltransferase [Roseibaca ekhonensis]SUZ31188.1 Ribosomal RNA small subunit methyltransferase C [Roseibaca ekhonensis]
MPHSPVTLAAPAPRAERLAHAMSEGVVVPDGRVTVLRPHAGERFDPIDLGRLNMVQGFRPDHDGLQQAGYKVSVDATPAPTVLVCLPRAKDHAYMLIAQAAALASDLVIVDGQKTDGIDSVLKALRGRVAVESLSKAHGRVLWFNPQGVDFADWAGAEQTVQTEFGPMSTAPGLFSADAVDPASHMLANALPPELPARMADFGAGWGYLSAAVLARRGVETLHVVEAEHDALHAARRNIADPRAQFHWADATSFALPESLGGIVMNPPFHVGREARPELGMAFISSAARALGTRGQLWVVANRHLPYAQALEDRFVHVSVVAEDNRFRVWHAKQPRKVKR